MICNGGTILQYVFDIVGKADVALISLQQNVFDGLIPDDIKAIGFVVFKVSVKLIVCIISCFL